MIVLLLLPVLLAAHAWVVFWLLKWLSVVSPVFQAKGSKILIAFVYYICVLAMYIAGILPQGMIEKFFRVIGYYWYGMSIYTFLLFLSAQLLRWIVMHTKLREKNWVRAKKTLIIAGAVCIFAEAAICVGGHINATILRTTEYEVTIQKECRLSELNVVLVADQHLGYNIGAPMMERMVEKINACRPDVVVVAGDVFDNCYANIKEPEKIEAILSQIESKYGVYAVLGNHDCEERIIGGFTFSSDEKKVASDGMYEFLEKSGMTLLCDESVLLEDSVYLFGRPDEERPGRDVEGERLTAKELMATMDQEKPVIVLEHEPKFLGESAEAGVDLHLAGHTHDGQLFPLNITTRLLWENSCGLLKKGNMTSIVTSGVGLYGPYLRVGTKPEVCSIHITFGK